MHLLLVLGFVLPLVAAQTYSGNSMGVSELPTDIPADTTTLNLDDNNLAQADFEALRGLALGVLSLRMNGFSTFPNLSSVGATLKSLDLGHNSIDNIDTALLKSFQALERLELEFNLLTAFPDLSPVGDTLMSLYVEENQMVNIAADLLVPLTKLTYLHMSANRELQFRLADLEPLADTLHRLRVGHCTGANIDNFSGFVDMMNLDVSHTNTSVMPVLPVPCDNLRVVHMSGNGLASLGAELTTCTSVGLLAASDNALTSLPNITGMGKSLRTLVLRNNMISELNQDSMRAQTVLSLVVLDQNELTQFPDVSRSGESLRELGLSFNQIASVDPSITRALVALTEVRFHGNQLTAFPDFTMSGATLVTLTVYSNKMSVLDQSLIHPLVHLHTLDLHGNRFAAVPDVAQLIQIQHLLLRDNPIRLARPRHLASLGSLLTVDLRDTALESLPTMCPQGAMTIRLEANPQLYLCSPGMAWLKQASLTVTATDVLCPELSKKWSATTFDDLRAPLRNPQPGDVKQVFLGGYAAGTFCPWPTPGEVLAGSVRECFSACLQEAGCSGFNYRREQAKCVLVAPSDSQLTVQKGFNHTEWDLYLP